MMPRKIILVFGPPGVGKTTLIKKFISLKKGFLYLSAGSLISNELDEPNRDFLRVTDKKNILKNQQVLVQNYLLYLSQHTDVSIIFDGHILLNNGNENIQIPFKVIKQLQPDKIIYISDTSENIDLRRQKDENRPNRPKESKEDIARFIAESVIICLEYAKNLNIPFIHMEKLDINLFINSINS
jgi:adenylate kinase